jgi:hypothetical protein
LVQLVTWDSEQDIRLKEAAIAAINNYGTQFHFQSHIFHPLYNELEQNRINVWYTSIITKNSTLGHLAVIPTLIRDEDGNNGSSSTLVCTKCVSAFKTTRIQ